ALPICIRAGGTGQGLGEGVVARRLRGQRPGDGGRGVIRRAGRRGPASRGPRRRDPGDQRMSRIDEVVAYAREALSAAADPEKAAGMQAYMKTDMLFYGVR